MRYIKTYETFDFSKTLPVASVSTLTSYYSCDDCDALWRSVNKQHDRCKFCQSNSIEELSVDEWYSMVEDRLDEDEIEDFRNEREEEELKFIDLYSTQKKDNSKNVN